jgi:von Willebrand factor type A domain
MRSNYLDFAVPAGLGPTQTVCTLSILDLSGSMDISDYQPNRLGAAIMATEAMLHEKIKLRPHDKVGIVGFSDKGIRVCPLTKVKDSQKIFRSLKNLNTIGSTNFVAGLKTAREMFEGEAGIRRPKPGMLQLLLGQAKPEPATGRITKFVPHAIFLSDGQHNGSSNAIHAAKKLKQLGVILDCIGIGGSPADVDEDCLKAMASAGPDGKPRYRFIGDSHTLLQDFKRMATLQVL